MSKLIVTLPDGTQTTHELTEPENTIGRTDENTLQISDISVSRGFSSMFSLPPAIWPFNAMSAPQALEMLCALHGGEHPKTRVVKALLASLMRAEDAHGPAFALYD